MVEALVLRPGGGESDTEVTVVARVQHRIRKRPQALDCVGVVSLGLVLLTDLIKTLRKNGRRNGADQVLRIVGRCRLGHRVDAVERPLQGSEPGVETPTLVAASTSIAPPAENLKCAQGLLTSGPPAS